MAEFPKTDSKDPIEILKFVAREVIRKEPKRYDQEDWILFLDKEAQFTTEEYLPELQARFPECGTICCVAGAVLLATNTNSYPSYSKAAAKVLKLDHWDADELFTGYAVKYQMIHEGFNPEDEPAKGTQEYAELGIRHIERFMREYMDYEGEPL